MVIGTIVRSNSHISYLCRVYGALETDNVPQPSDYAFGTFVIMEPVPGSDLRLVGVISDTILINPDYGNLGPRLSTDDDLAVLSPDYLNEKGVLVDVLVLGSVRDGHARHDVPALAAQVGTRVETMDLDLVCAFHSGPRGTFLAGYLPQLLQHNDPMMAGLLLTLLDRLDPHFPQSRKVIGVLKNNLSWKARVVPAG